MPVSEKKPKKIYILRRKKPLPKPRLPDTEGPAPPTYKPKKLGVEKPMNFEDK